LLYEGGRQARFKISKYSVNVLTHGFYFNDTKDLIIQIVNRMIDHRYYHDSRTPSLSPFFEESFREWVKGKERGRKYDPDRARSDRGSEDSYRIFKPKLILGRDYHVFIRIPSNDFPSDFDRSNINIEVYDSEDTAIVSFGPGDLKIYDLIGSQKKYRVLCNRLIPLKNAIGGFRYRYYSTDDFKYEKRRYLFFNENGNEVFPNRDFEGICYALTPVPITGVEKQMEFQDPEEKFWVSCFAVDPKTVIRVGEELLFFNSADRLGIRCEPYRNIEGVTGEKNSFKVYREIDSFSFETTKMISDIKLHLDDTEVSLDSPAFSDSGEVLEINSGKEGIHRFLINLKNPLLPGFHKMWLFEKDGGTLIESLGLEDRMFAVDPDLTIESSFENEEVFVSGTTIQPQRLTFDLQEEEKIVPGSLGVHAYNFKNPLLRYCWDDESPNRVVGAQVHSSILERHIFLNVFSNSPSLTAKLVDTISGKEKEWQVVARDGCFKLYIPEARDFVENHAIVDLSLTSDDTTATIRFFSVPFPLSQGFGFALKPLEDPAKRVLEIEGSYCGEGKILLKVFKEGKEDPLLKLPIQNDDKEKKNFGSNVKGLSPNTLWTVQLVGETEPDPFSRQGVLSAVVFEKKINWGSFACLKVGLLYAIVTADWDDGSGNSGTYNYLVADEARRYCATLRIISLDLDKKICKAYAYDTNFCKEERLGLLELALQEESEGKTCVFEIRRQDGGPVFAHGNGLLDNTWSALNKRVKSIEMMNSGNTLEGWKERRKNHVK
ncbi:MAG: hypothetical protein J5736_05395, partial [Bacilli bacterium]|nr:hypothetical protein [Bacilli bacterium]